MFRCNWSKTKKEGIKMLKKFFARFGVAFAAAALFIGQISANLPCDGPFYQPKVPEKLIKH